jgi:hypothetical protein
MKKLFLITLIMWLSHYLEAQVTLNGGGRLLGTVNVSDPAILDLDIRIRNFDLHPLPSAAYGDLKAIRNAERRNPPTATTRKKSRGVANNPLQTKGTQGNLPNGIPPDNDIAVSNSGIVLSVVNDNLKVTNDTFKNIVTTRSLTSLVAGLGNFQYLSDPRVLYDPVQDRFVMCFFGGSDSWDTHIFVGFSKTNRPDSNWNFYELPGNSFNDSTWSDYPIMAMNDDDLYITFNHVKDNVSWQIGFKQSVIWQIDKNSGYSAATTLPYTLWSDLKLGNTFYRNICPAKPQIIPFGNDMYFLSVRNVAMSNDSVFLLHINNSQQSGNAQLTAQALKSDISYGFPPNVPMKNKNYLMTNDGRVLSAIKVNDRIHFGANSFNPAYNNAAVYLGAIENVSTAPSVKAKLWSDSSNEYAYPSMCYMGNGDQILYTFSQCYTDSFPGCAMLYKNSNHEFSDILKLGNGTTAVNQLNDTTERWGDYSNTQRKYNEPGIAYMANTIGFYSTLRTWLARIQNTEYPLSVPELSSALPIQIYPVPVMDRLTVAFDLATRTRVNIQLVDLNGNLIQQLPHDYLKPGRQEVSINTAGLLNGNYLLRGMNDEGVVIFSRLFLK